MRCFSSILSFSFETTLSARSNKAVITLYFADVGLCDLVFSRFLLRWICHDFVGLRCQGMGDWSCFLLLW